MSEDPLFMYPRNRKKRTFYSPGTEDKSKRRREDEDSEFKPETEKATRSSPTHKSPSTPPSSDSTTSPSPAKQIDDANKPRKSKHRNSDKRGDGSDDDEQRNLRRSKRHTKDDMENEFDEGGDAYGYSDSGSEGDERDNESGGNESGDESPSHMYHNAQETFSTEEHSHFDGSDYQVNYFDESDKRHTETTTNGLPPSSSSSSSPHENNGDTIMQDTKPTSSSSSPSGHSNEHESGNSSHPPFSTSGSPQATPIPASTSPIPRRERLPAYYKTGMSEKYKKNDTPIPKVATTNKPQPIEKNNATTTTTSTPTTSTPTTSTPTSKHSTPTISTISTLSTIHIPDSVGPDNIKSLLEEMKAEITRLNYRIEESTQNHTAKLQEYEEKYVPRGVYNALEDEVTYLKRQVQSYSTSQLDMLAARGLDKVKAEMAFLRTSFEEVNTEVRQWRMAMDVDMTDKEERLAQLSQRLDDIERNQQALIIRYPQLMQPLGPQPSQATPSERPSSSEKQQQNMGSGSQKGMNNMQKERDKHSQSQRMMLPPDMPPKYHSSNAPSSPQPSSSSSFINFESSSYIQPEPGGWNQSVYGRGGFAPGSAAGNPYFHSSSGSNYKSSSSGSSGGKHHHAPLPGASHDRPQGPQAPSDRHPHSHHDRDRLQQQQQDRMFQGDKSARPW